MKKIISFLLVTALVFALAVPAFAAETEDSFVKKVYFKLDAEELSLDKGLDDNGLKAASQAGGAAGFSNASKGNMTFIPTQDALKGGKSLNYTLNGSTTAYFYYSSPLDCVAGDRYVISFSTKGDIHAAFQGIGDLSTATSDFTYRYISTDAANNKLKTVGKSAKDIFAPTTGDWHHVVAEIVPGETYGDIIFYIDGVQVGSSTSVIYTIANFGKAWTNKAYLLLSTRAGGVIDDFTMYKTAEKYDPAKAGDLAKIESASLSVAGSEIEYTTEATLTDVKAKLTASAGGSIAFLTADDVAIEDETAPANGIKVVARSASGATFKVYTLKQGETPSYLRSDVYTIADGTISGVPHFVALDVFKAAFTVDGTATPVYSTTGAYVQEGDTVTLGSTVYTVKLDTYYKSTIVDKATLLVDGKAGTDASYAGNPNETFEGKLAHVVKVKGANGGVRLRYKNFGALGFENGDVINQEFSFFTREDSTLRVVMANNQVFTAVSCDTSTGAESGRAGETMSESLVPNAWNKIVISAIVNDGSDPNNKATKYRVFVNGVQCESANYNDGYFRKENFNWTSNEWTLTMVTGAYDAENPAASYIALSDFKVYKSTISDYDTSITAGDYHAEDGAIYLPTEAAAAAAISAVDAGGKAIEIVEGANAMDTVVKVTDFTGIRTETYKLRLENTIYEENGRYKAYSPEAARLYFATYNGDSFVNVVGANSDGTKALKIRKNALTVPEGGTSRVFLWSKNMKPIAAR